MKRRQFLALACASTAFANACKSDEPTPATIVQGTITDAAGKPVVGLEVTYYGIHTGGIITPVSLATFTEKTITYPNGFFKIIKIIPDGINQSDTEIHLPNTVYQKYTIFETRKNGKLISGSTVIAQQYDIEFGKTNEYLVILK